MEQLIFLAVLIMLLLSAIAWFEFAVSEDEKLIIHFKNNHPFVILPNLKTEYLAQYIRENYPNS